jgi:hypothetical protein
MAMNNLGNRRLAVQLAAQLPEDLETCLAVLDLTRQLVTEFICKDEVPSRRVVPIKPT